MEQSLWLEKFINVYQELGTENLTSLSTIYHPRITFIDPLHKAEGLKALIDRFHFSYENILQCDFAIDHVFQSNNEAAVYWTMTFRHTSLNGKQPIIVNGHSHLRAEDGLVIFHRDYLDVGAMIYEHVPFLGIAVKKLKQRAS
ncbi:nuclear transport factor 2 family protein [Vibrio sp. ZSDE26]|uniref:Nuclear transport factor 2 family protein n=1 Tax=Vibrio amylolyticus TaxID=2847292 RepID=A0A9X2BK84_9VIBR|nr:nuclear transport factor 2 family protein [Vibrio amylolyticus]MCK6264217.1 nuclear transport factor 2 family protein [Vibrio amylolyticus]